MTRFIKQNLNPSWGNEQTLTRETSKYETVNLENNKCAFSNRRPRKDSKYASYPYMVCSLEENYEVKFQ